MPILDSSGKKISTEMAGRNAVWQQRIDTANRYFELWARKYKVDSLERAYYGHQWDLESDYEPYVTNEIFAAIDVKQPSLLFKEPVFSVRPKPSKTDFDVESASRRALLRSDALNHFAQSDKVGLGEASELAILDAYFRFGLVEVGYSADWVDNPNADKPVLGIDRGEIVDDDGEVVKEPKKLPKDERLFVKRIPSQRFRVGVLDTQRLDQCTWCGYWEYVRTADLVSNKNFTFSRDLISDRSADALDTDDLGVEALSDEIQESSRNTDLTKLWYIWDLRERKKIYFAETLGEIIREVSFKRVPLFPLKFRNRLTGFYPLPLTFNWISPQVEMNETREAARAHRRQFQRKHVVNRDDWDEDELQRLQTGGDGTIAITKRRDPAGSIVPVPNADLGAQHQQALVVSRNDFDNIAGVTAEQRGTPTQTTATQSRIVDLRASVRESRDQMIVAKWFVAIGKEILLQAKEKLTEDFWVRLSIDSEGDFDEIQETQDTFRLISTDAFGDDDFDVNISIESMSPIANQREKEKYLEFLAVLTQYPIISLSAPLVRETAARLDYRNERVIRTFQRIALAAQLGQLAQAEQQIAQMTGGVPLSDSSNPIAQRDAAQATPNTNEQIRNQIANQSTVVQ